MPEEIKKIERRMFRHSLEDGVFEIVFGISFLLSGLFVSRRYLYHNPVPAEDPQ